MPTKEKRHRSKVFLWTFDENGELCDTIVLQYSSYYEESHPIIDDGAYRACLGVRNVKGKIYNSSGELQSEFENWYDEKGKYLRSRSVHQDGTVIED